LVSGKIIIITAPSGSGKTTLVKQLLTDMKQLQFSISACTRAPRNNETHGKDYYFYSVDTFKKLIEEDAFAEWEMVYEGKYYGTLKTELQRIWSEGCIPLVDVDVEGALSIQNVYPDSSLTIFIQPPSIEELRARLLKRGTETIKSLEERISKASLELSFAPQFDKIIINDKIELAAEEFKTTVMEFLKD
jgi:guanylate kinase